MPELPEIEVARETFHNLLVGKKITSFDCDVLKMIRPTLAEFAKAVKGLKIKRLKRSTVWPVVRLSLLSLKPIEKEKIFKAIKKIIPAAVRHGSTSYDSYAGEDGDMANYNKYLRAYQMHGQPCFRKDGGIMKKIKINGRSSHFCPVCQK
mgnify:CR=1 FL=1